MPDLFAAGQRVTAAGLNARAPVLLTSAAITANSSTIASTTEVAFLTTASVTLKNGRCYRFDLNGLLQHATASLTDLLSFRIRRTSATGTQIRALGDSAVTNRTSASRNNVLAISALASNQTGADITDVVVVTAAWETGSSATFLVAASSALPTTLSIWDVGPASDYPTVAPIT